MRADCELLFEQRWADRKSKLAAQPGLLGFSLLRRRGTLGRDEEPFTYSTATLWASEAAWSAWREGEGKNAHAASRNTVRTPVSEWMDGPASPIFWDVPLLVHAGRGLRHTCAGGREEGRRGEGGAATGAATGDATGDATNSGDAANDGGGGGGMTAADAAWTAMLGRLTAYRERWGNADAPLGPTQDGEIGRWCKAQRLLHDQGTLSADRQRALEALGFSWVAPTDVDNPLDADWDDMLTRLRAYAATSGGACDVPKKFQPDPLLGGWVAAVRRNKAQLNDAQLGELDAIGFAWESTRGCGSAFMKRARELQAFVEVHGHADVARVRGEEDELSRWCDTQRKALREGTLSPKRSANLRKMGMKE